MDTLDSIRGCVRPVIFETGSDDAPCSTAGTAFLVGFRQSLFVLTAAHVVRYCPVESVLVFPSDNSTHPLRYLNWWFVEENPEAPDTSDLLIIRADKESIPTEERKAVQLLNLNDTRNVSWFEERQDSQFFLCGFPVLHNEVDYSTLEIKTQQYFLEAVYVGPSPFNGCHELSVKNPLKLQHFSGLSGSPVFSHRFSDNSGTPARFCGMALRGTAESTRIHFLEVEALISILSDAENANKNLPIDRSQAANL